MHEKDGCALLKRRFEAAGFRIQENVAFDEGGVSFEIDGWDPGRRVGYEYLTAEAGDRDDLTEAEMKKLEARMQRGELFVLLVDEREAPDADLLGRAADGFLRMLPATHQPAKKPAKKKKQNAAKKPAKKKPAAKKRVKKKPIGKKRAPKAGKAKK